MLTSQKPQEDHGVIVESTSENKTFYIAIDAIDTWGFTSSAKSGKIESTTEVFSSTDYGIKITNILCNEKFELGFGWRINEFVSAIMNFVINKNLRLGYAYDHTLANYGQYNSGSHEVFFLYDLVLKVRNIKSPRFF